jgi:hypothetical protein
VVANIFIHSAKPLAAFLACAVLIGGLMAQTYGMGWPAYTVDDGKCTCSCFDSAYKGRLHAVFPPVYKHVYFNMRFETACLLALIFGSLLGLTTIIQKIVCCVADGTCDKSVIALVALSIYPNFYGLWCVFNYVNDRFYPMLWSQVFFSASEVYVTSVLYRLLAKGSTIPSQHVHWALAVASVHILLAAYENVLWGVFQYDKGLRNLRDTFLMSSDVLTVIYLLQRFADLASPISTLARPLIVRVTCMLVFYALFLRYS